MEVHNQRVVQDIPGRYPTSLVCTIPLPVDEILHPPATGVQQSLNRIGGRPVHYARGWGDWAKAGRMKGRGNIRFNPGYMKNRVNPTKSRRESEPDCHRVNHLCDTEWPDELRFQLARGRPERQVLGGEPYPLTTNIGRRRRTVAVGCCLGSSSSSGQNSSGLLPSSSTAFDEGQSRRNRSIRFL